MSQISAHYQSHGVPSRELQTEVDKIWQELASDSIAKAKLAADGVPIDDIDWQVSSPIKIEPKAAGADLYVAFLIHFASAGAFKVFELVVLPRLINKFGRQSITKKD